MLSLAYVVFLSFIIRLIFMFFVSLFTYFLHFCPVLCHVVLLPTTQLQYFYTSFETQFTIPMEVNGEKKKCKLRCPHMDHMMCVPAVYVLILCQEVIQPKVLPKFSIALSNLFKILSYCRHLIFWVINLKYQVTNK